MSAETQRVEAEDGSPLLSKSEVELMPRKLGKPQKPSNNNRGLRSLNRSKVSLSLPLMKKKKGKNFETQKAVSLMNMVPQSQNTFDTVPSSESLDSGNSLLGGPSLPLEKEVDEEYFKNLFEQDRIKGKSYPSKMIRSLKKNLKINTKQGSKKLPEKKKRTRKPKTPLPRMPVRAAMKPILPFDNEVESDDDSSSWTGLPFPTHSGSNHEEEDGHIEAETSESSVEITEEDYHTLISTAVSLRLKTKAIELSTSIVSSEDDSVSNLLLDLNTKKKAIEPPITTDSSEDDDVCNLLLNLNTVKSSEEGDLNCNFENNFYDGSTAEETDEIIETFQEVVFEAPSQTEESKERNLRESVTKDREESNTQDTPSNYSDPFTELSMGSNSNSASDNINHQNCTPSDPEPLASNTSITKEEGDEESNFIVTDLEFNFENNFFDGSIVEESDEIIETFQEVVFEASSQVEDSKDGNLPESAATDYEESTTQDFPSNYSDPFTATSMGSSSTSVSDNINHQNCTRESASSDPEPPASNTSITKDKGEITQNSPTNSVDSDPFTELSTTSNTHSESSYTDPSQDKSNEDADILLVPTAVSIAEKSLESEPVVPESKREIKAKGMQTHAELPHNVVMTPVSGNLSCELLTPSAQQRLEDMNWHKLISAAVDVFSESNGDSRTKKATFIDPFAELCDSRTKGDDSLSNIKSIYLGPIFGSSLECVHAPCRLKAGLGLGGILSKEENELLSSLVGSKRPSMLVLEGPTEVFGLNYPTSISIPIFVDDNTYAQNSDIEYAGAEVSSDLKKVHDDAAGLLAAGDFKKAVALLESFLGVKLEEDVQDCSQENIIDVTLRNIGSIHMFDGNFQDAMQSFKSVSDRELEEGKAANLILLGMSLYGLEFFDEASQAFLRALTVLRHTDVDEDSKEAHYLTMGKILNNVGCTFLELGSHKSSSRSFHSALRAYIQGRERTDVMVTDDDTLSSTLKTLDQQAEFWMKSKSTSEIVCNVTIALNNLAFVLYERGKYGDAIACLERSLKLQNSAYKENHCFTIGTMESLSSLYVRNESYQKALEVNSLLLKADQNTLKNQQQYHSLMFNIHTSMTEIHMKSTDFSSAMDYVALARNHQDILFSLSDDSSITFDA